MGEAVISVGSLSKCFKIYKNPWHRAFEWASMGRRKMHADFWALKDISFEVKRGECLGVIGPNGAGKSTLLKILTRALYPTSGTFSIQGRVLSLLELGTGFNGELTGRQNIRQSARMLNFPEGYVEGRTREIEEFAELGEFFDRPIKMYSSGMYVRLAFSMFAHMEPQVLIVDEALSVGDIFFQQKSFARMREIIKSGTACIFVSHNMDSVRNLCDKAVLLRNGAVGFMGDPGEAVSRYFSTVGKRPRRGAPPKGPELSRGLPSEEMDISEVIEHDILKDKKKTNFGAGGMVIEALRVTDKAGRDTLNVDLMEPLSFFFLLRADEDVADPVVGVSLFDRMGNCVFSGGNRQLRHRLPALAPGDRLVVRLDVTMSVKPGEYTFGIAAGEPAERGPGLVRDGVEMLGPIVVTFDMDEVPPFFGMAKLPTEARHCLAGRPGGAKAALSRSKGD